MHEKINEKLEKRSLHIKDDDHHPQATLRYAHTESGDITQRHLTLSEPVLVNSASKDNILCVLREIGTKRGIKIYGSGTMVYFRAVIIYNII